MPCSSSTASPRAVSGYGSAGAAEGAGGDDVLAAAATGEGAGGGAAGLPSAQQASDPASPIPSAAFVRFKVVGDDSGDDGDGQECARSQGRGL